mgnify:CR=1 FL=1
MDKVFIEQLEVITTIGVYDWEQEIKQKLVLDIEMAHDNRPAGKSDDVVDALDYSLVSGAVLNHIEGGRFPGTIWPSSVSRCVAVFGALISTSPSAPTKN